MGNCGCLDYNYNFWQIYYFSALLCFNTFQTVHKNTQKVSFSLALPYAFSFLDYYFY